MEASLLFLSSNPPNTEHLDIEEEGRVIKEATRPARDGGALRFEWGPAARTEDILNGLLKKPTIVHFSGHGLGAVAGARGSLGEAEAPKGEIVLRDERGKAVAVPREALSKLFELLQGTRCVVLNACFSEEQGKELAAHVDYVIGTRAAVPDDAAISFSKGFYEAINARKSLATAFALGCVMVEARGHKPEDLYAAWAREGVDPAKIVIVRPQRSPWVMAGLGMAAVAAAGLGLYLYTRPITVKLTIIDDRGKAMAQQEIEMTGEAPAWSRSSKTDDVGIASFAGLARSLLGQRVRVCLRPTDGEDDAHLGISFLLQDEGRVPICKRNTAYVKPNLPLVLKIVPKDATTSFKVRARDARNRDIPVEQTDERYRLPALGEDEAKISIGVKGGSQGYSIQLSQGEESVFSDANIKYESGQGIYWLYLRSGGPCAQGARADDFELTSFPCQPVYKFQM